MARSDDMLTKQFTGEAAAELWLDWRLLPAWLDVEQRLSRLAGWVLAAERGGGAHYGLQDPGRGDRARARRRACRRLLAGARALRNSMKGVAHPLSPEVRLATHARPRAALRLAHPRVAPHALRAPWWLTLLTLCLFAWRIHYSLNPAPLPSRWLILGVAAVAMFAVWLEYRTLFGRQPGILLLMLFSGLKVLETRTHRDAAAAAFLGYFLIITNLLYTQSIATALLMAAALYAITVTLIGFSAPNRAPRANLRTAALLFAHAAPAALALFLLFPRVQGPLWGLPHDAYAGMTGLSETMTPGDAFQPRAFRQHRLARRVRRRLGAAAGAALLARPGAVGLRRPHLDHGRRNSSPACRLQRASRGSYRYSVVLEPHNRTWLFALESAASVPRGAVYTDDGQLLNRTHVRARTRYEMTSTIAPALSPQEDPRNLRRALRLPPGSNPKALSLAAEWRAASRGPGEVLERAIALPAAGPLCLHARAAASRREPGGRIPLHDEGGVLRALRFGLRVPDARRRRAGARGDRLPGRRAQSGRPDHHGAPVRRPCLGRGLPAQARLGARRPDGNRRAGPARCGARALGRRGRAAAHHAAAARVAAQLAPSMGGDGAQMERLGARLQS